MAKQTETRVFFVVDSINDNEEIFETLESARSYIAEFSKPMDKPRLYVALVKNAYREPKDGAWNYEDLANTFSLPYNIEL